MINLDEVLCLFNANIEKVDADYIIKIPDEQIQNENIEVGDTYRIALTKSGENLEMGIQSELEAPGLPQPPVEVGEIRYIEIESLGKQGDGIARAERGYVIIVPESSVGEQVKVEIIDVKQNFAMASIIEDVLE
tara:strand:+ start:2261 stop:2662 length:402 start_codon:yes stop_codon:yes gene_type:complete